MNTQSINTATKESSERWVKPTVLLKDGFVRNIHSEHPFDVLHADVEPAGTEKQAKQGRGLHYEVYESHSLGMQATAEEEYAYWLSREKAAVKAATEIDVHIFHDALGVMYPLNWCNSENGECETFMLAEMICGNVAEIYARIGMHYYRMRDYSYLDHAEILARIKEVLDQSQK